jgi:serine/threonine-protein kinase
MGLVYRARHIALDRVVALKVVLAGEHASSEQRARFLTEAQAVARLVHPNIVQIYEIGQTAELPYFSLEYVDGGSLERKVDRQPQDPQWAAALVETIARAMHVAHRNGVIHRDLKPSNVLLTRDGVPKIADFGLAKRIESDSGQTHTGDIMGTPTYMAPEQAWGWKPQVGPRSDLYSLGATLYTLLTGRPPIQGTTPMETIEQVRTQEPVPPSRLQPKIPRDLETICLKCLQKEPEKRYATAEDLADDLRRFLQGDTILARPVSAPERLWRLARRNPKVAALTASATLLLVAVAVISMAYAAVLRQKNIEVGKLLMAANAEKEAREVAFEQNRAALNAWRSLGRLVMQDLKELQVAQPLRQKVLDEVYSGIRRTIAGMEPLYSIYRLSKNAREADFAMAGVYKLLGDELLEMNQVRAAMEHYRRMGLILEEAAAADTKDVDIKVQLANNRAVLGYVILHKLGDPKAAEGYLKQALELRRERLKSEPESDVAKIAVANALGALATCYQKAGNLEAARGLFEWELRVRESLREPAKRDYETRRELSGLHQKLGELSIQLGDVHGARVNYDRSFDLRESLAKEDPSHLKNRRDLYLSITNFGDMNLVSLKDAKAAKAYYEKALEGYRKLVAANPSAVHKGDVSFGCYYLATALLRLGDTAGAARLYRECLDLRRELVKDPEAKVSRINLAVAMARCGEHEGAAMIARQLIESSPKNVELSIESACALALCAGSAPDVTLRRTYTEDSLAILRKGIAEGWSDFERLKDDPDLDPIRDDAGFRHLLQEHEDGKRPGPAP